MKYDASKRWFRLSVVVVMLCLSRLTLVHAQSISNYAFTTSTSGTLEDLSTGATSLVTGNNDSYATAITPIGFNFGFMGGAYSHFSANSNGQFLFHTSGTGSAITSGTAATPISNMPYLTLMSGDNEVANGMRYKVIGTAPNRIFVLEWTEFYVYWTNITNAGNMQLWLHEGTGVIEYVYGEIYNSASSSQTRSIGLSSGNTATTAGFVTVSATPTFTAAATFTTNTFAANTGGTTATPLIANLGSNANGSRRIYTFTPTQPDAPSALSFTAIGATVMTLNWTDNSSTELGYRVYRSMDGITYSQVAQLPANTTSYSATLLSMSTMYHWKVVAYQEIESLGALGTETTLAAALAGGIKTVGTGGDYENLTTAFADINAQGLTGDVELQLITGYPAAPETYPIASCNSLSTGTHHVKVYPTVSGLSITSANTAGTLNLNGATNLTFDGRVNQTGAADLVISNTNAGASYAVQFVNDASNNTLQYLTIHSANTSTSSGTIVFAGSTGTTGNDNNLIDHCDIKDGATTPLNGIYSAGTSTAIDNSGNTISNSTISNYFGASSASNGIFLSSNSSGWTIDANKFYQTATRTLTSGALHRGINIIAANGSGFVITNNVIGYADGSATGITTYTGSAGRFFGIELTASNTGAVSTIQGNTISGISLTTTSGTTAAPGVFAGISVLAGNVEISYNTIGLESNPISASTSSTASLYGIHASSSATLVITNNAVSSIQGTGSAASATCNIYGINSTGSGVATTISNNTIGGSATGALVTGTSGVTTASSTVSGIETGTVTTLTMLNNEVSYLVIQGAAGTINGIKGGTSQFTIENNTIHDLAITANSGSSASAIYGVYNWSSPTIENIVNNQIYNLSIAGANTNTSTNNISGVATNTSSSSVKNYSRNQIYNLSYVNSSTGTAVVNGVSSTLGATVSIFKNKIYNLSSSGAGSTVNGVLVPSGTNVDIYNNVIGDLKTPIASAADPIRGISITSTTSSATYRVYYNSVYLNASSTGTNFGSSGVYHTASTTGTTSSLDLRNNIIINESTPSGTGIVAALRRSSASLGNFNSASNRNLLYAGTPATNRLIMYDGTNSYQSISTYQTAVSPREINSFTGESLFTATGYGTAGNFFISTIPANTDYLKPVVGITTQVESGAENITTPAITDDFSATIRQGNAGYTGTGTAPDLGAFEFEGVTPTPVVTLNSVTPPATEQCVAVDRLISVDVNPSVGTTVTVNIEYSINGVAQSPIAMTNVSGTIWEGTIPVPSPTNATIAWGVSAVNSSGISGTYIGTSYSDEPLTGVLATASASSQTVCAGTNSDLTATLSKNGSATIGTAMTLTGDTEQPTAFCNRWSSYRMQTIYTAAELTSAGLLAGPITSMAFNITTLGSANSNNNFAVKIGETTLSTFTNFVVSTNFTTVFPSATYTHAIGMNVINFSTPYMWDGISNIVIEVSHSGANSINNSQTYYTVTSGSTVVTSTNGSATGTLSTKRLNVVLTGNASTAIQTVSWSDGVTTVGTTNPLTVNPITTTTYTATITAAGCTVSPSPMVTVTVNQLPTPPTVINSAQCGVQIPTASVASTSGLPTPTFNWYTTSTGGTTVQSGTSNTFASTVSSTTTFYVSELNSTTGCESPRVPLTVTVSVPDQVSLTASSSSICIGESFTLTAANLNMTPFQIYTYSTVGTIGSGLEAPTAGASIPSVTPTVPGTYTYELTAVDGGCAATATASVVVNSLPVISTATALPSVVCSDAEITLTATSMDVGSAPVTIGTQSTTEFGGSVYRFGNGIGDYRHQLIYTASELTAAGVMPGNISGIRFNVTSVGTGSANNFTIKLGNTTATALTATFLLDPTSTVYNATNYTAVAGANTHNFSTPFNWDGVSNLLVEICYNVSVTGGSSTVAATTPSALRNSNLLGTTNACTAVSGTTYANRPLASFIAQTTTNIAASLDWNWSPGVGLNTPIAITSVNNTTATPITQPFTVMVTNPTTGCVATATTAAVTINNAAPAPIANNSTQCGIGTPAASVTGTGISGNTFSWYLNATGGTAIAGQTGNTLTAYPISTTTTFYVEENNGTCMSARTPVTVTVTAPPSISIAGATTICSGESTALTVSSANDPDYTYTWSGGLGTGATVSASPTTATTYTVTATDASSGANSGCVNIETYSISVNPAPTAVVASSSTGTVCEGNTINLFASANSNTSVLSSLSEGFETFPASGWTMINAGSGNPWTSTSTAAHSGSKGITYSYDEYNSANAWAISPQLNMVAGQTYAISFWYKVQSSSFVEKLKVTVGNAATVAAQVTTLWNNNGGTGLTNTTWAQGTATFTPVTSGNYYFGFNCYSSADEYDLHVDDINIQYTQPGALPTYSWTSSPAGFTSSVQNPTGVAPTVNTTYTVTATNSLGCSNSATVDVMVNQPSSATVSASNCDSFTWGLNNATYTSSGSYTATIPNAVGCDSVVTLNLTITNSTLSSVEISNCESYTWPQTGLTYNTSGLYRDTLTNAVGCDSVITLDLTIYPVEFAAVQTVLACQTYNWAQTGLNYSVSGLYYDTLQSVHGCDSIITLDLSIGAPVSATQTVSTCESSYLWPLNGQTYSVSGSYTNTTLTVHGCDSVVTLNLTINPVPLVTATNNGDLTITASTGTSYQWINCTTNAPIAGATTQTFTATANGSYAVIVSNGTCSDTSNCVSITTVGIKENMISTVEIYPNPTQDVVYITMDATIASVEVFDVQGKLLKTATIKSGDEIDLKGYERGVYTIRVKTEHGTAVERVVKN